MFVLGVFLTPDESSVEFSEKRETQQTAKSNDGSVKESSAAKSNTASAVWGSSQSSGSKGGRNEEVNQNTSMILGSKNGNAKTQLRAGVHLALRILDKVIVSQDSVPVLAELLFDAVTDSGLKIEAGTRLYGEASFQKGTERAEIRFHQLSLKSGEIRPFNGLALGKDGQPGVPGRIYSDGMKNTTGQIITTFVSGLAAGSMETDILGKSKGGLENGILAAVSGTARERAQAYGEKLKNQREWLELTSGTECDVLLNDSLNLQPTGGDL